MTPPVANSDAATLGVSLSAFVRFRQAHLQGRERGEAHIFLDRFFRALGHEGVPEAGAILERGIRRPDDGGTSYADLDWKPRVLIEMKKSGSDLKRYFSQAFEYWMYLVPNRPKYVMLCNFDEFWIYDFDRQLEEPVDVIPLADLPRRWEAFSFMLPVEERPIFANDLEAVTRESAARVARVFNALVDRGIDREQAQRFILQVVMAMFSEDIGLLPTHSFTRAIDDVRSGGSAFDLVFGLFNQMNSPGRTPSGRYQGTPYFNGGLFSEITPFELEDSEIDLMHDACQQDWSQVKPVIFGTLFEQSLDQDERHAFGAHFTSEVDIQKVVIPCVVRPWRERISGARSAADIGRLETELRSFKVLDPACGSGNFLYVAYRELRRIERELAEKRATLPGGRRRGRPGPGQAQLSFVSPRQFFGIDIRPFAVEVAKVTLMLARKLAADELQDEQVVLPLDDLDDNFLSADSLLVEWPPFDVCIGNPPYLGRRLLRRDRGSDYAARLEQEFPDVGGVSDYVTYFYRRAHDYLPPGCRAGLVGTNTIRQGDSRRASLDYIISNQGSIFEAVSSQPWSGEAGVSVSIVNWAKQIEISPKYLWVANGSVKIEVDSIPGSLSLELDLTNSKRLRVNRHPKVCFQGQTPGMSEGFILTREEAAELVRRDASSARVIHPYLIGDELMEDGQPQRFIIDVPSEDIVSAENFAPAAFRRLRDVVLPIRRRMAEEEEERNRLAREVSARASTRHHYRQFLQKWWQLSYRRKKMLDSISPLERYIGVSRVASELRPSIYVFLDPSIRPGDALTVFALEDDYSFGILASTVHRRWFEERCSTFETRLRYTSNSIFETFPWPQNPTEESIQSITKIVSQILESREAELARGRTLASVYDTFRLPGRNLLRDLHDALDNAVLDAYGFDQDDDVLAQLLALNEALSTTEADSASLVRGPGSDRLNNTMVTRLKVKPLPLTFDE